LTTFSGTWPRWKLSVASVIGMSLSSASCFGEEVGELFKAIRKHEKIRVATNSVTGTVDEELADILIYLCAIANRLDIRLIEAFRKKEALNEKRSWV
jgi:NTP pyrophosphatase (non-canonical NTP hydrolase)